MARKRGNNEGSVFYIASQKLWRAMVTIDGHRLSKYGKSKKECQVWLDDTLSKLSSGLTYEGAQVRLTSFMEDWLTNLKSGVKPNTWYQYNMTTQKYILPFLGNYLVKDLRPDLIQRLYNAKQKEGLGVRTVQYMHQVLHGALDYAVKLDILPRNPTNACYKPRDVEHEMQVYNEDQVNRLLMAVEGTRFEALFQLAFTTGMRQSELLGLKWSDLDWKNKTITLTRQLSRDITGKANYVPPVGKATKMDERFTQLKTTAAKRKLNLGNATMDSLRRHQAIQDDERRNPQRVQWIENDLIFPSITGTPMSQANLYHRFKTLIKEIGLPDIRFHDLRHTAASLMLNHGIPPIVVSKRLGHKNVSITLDTYGHLIPEINSDIGQIVDDLITPVRVDFTKEHSNNEFHEESNDIQSVENEK